MGGASRNERRRRQEAAAERKPAIDRVPGSGGKDNRVKVGIVVAVVIALLGLRMARSTVETLVDRAPKGASDKATAAIRAVPGVLDVERLRVRMVGSTHFIDAVVQVPRTYPIDRVEEIKRKAQANVARVLDDADLAFTAVPVARDNESVRERIMVIARNSGLAVHHVTVHDLGGRLTVSIDLEVDGNMALAAAHGIAPRVSECRKRQSHDHGDRAEHVRCEMQRVSGKCLALGGVRRRVQRPGAPQIHRDIDQ